MQKFGNTKILRDLYTIKNNKNKPTVRTFKPIKMRQIKRLMRKGFLECVTELKIGYVEIRVLHSGIRGIVLVK